MGKFKFIFLAATILFALAHQASAEITTTVAPDAVMPTPPSSPFALTISGGISLGSYEAGVNWALIEFMKKRVQPSPSPNYLNPELSALTGASAGSINAAMSAINWCLDPARGIEAESKNAIDDNLLRSVWLQVGIDELLPKDESGYSSGQSMPPDALFSRHKAFKDSIEQFKKILDKRVFKDSCRIPIGMLTTKEIAPEIAVDNVKVRNQRFVFALEFVSKDGWGYFRTVKVDEDDPDFGSVVYLPGRMVNDELRLDKNDVVNLLYASSAFPVAFSKIHLSYCTNREGEGGSEYCPPGTNLMDANFVDGGVFDNIPLGVARALAEPSPLGLKFGKQDITRNGRRHWFFFISPSNRRGIVEFPSNNLKHRSTTYGLKGMTSFLPGVVNTLGDYELYTLLRSGKWSRQSHLHSVKLLELLKNNPKLPSHLDKFSISKEIETVVNRKDRELAERSLGQQNDHYECIQNRKLFIETNDALLEGNNLPFAMVPEGPRLMSVSQLRYSLLGCLADTANMLGREDLAYNIRQSIADRFGDRKVYLTSRHFAITGGFLDHFGAFLDLGFREFDYYSGIYDTVNDMAKFSCQTQPLKTRESCIGDEARGIYSDLGIAASSKGRTVFLLLAQHEYPDYLQKTYPWNWITSIKKDDLKMEQIFNSLLTAVESSEAKDEGNDKFTVFVRSLKRSGYQAHELTKNEKTKEPEISVMETILTLSDENPISWYGPVVGRIGKRLQLLQAQESEVDPKSAGFHYLAKAAALGFGKYYIYDRGFTLAPSSEPSDSWFTPWKLIPFELAADLANGGFSASYMPQYRKKNCSLDLKTTLAGYANFPRGRVGFSQVDLYGSYHSHEKFHSFGVGPTLNIFWREVPGYDRVNLGVAGYVEMFRTLRMTIGVRMADASADTRNNFYVLFGITDLPGVFSRIFK